MLCSLLEVTALPTLPPVESNSWAEHLYLKVLPASGDEKDNWLSTYMCVSIFLSRCVSVFLYVCMYACMSFFLCVCMYVCLSVCVYIGISVFLYVCMYVC